MAKTPGTPQSSNKAGLRSSGKKMANSRHGFDTHPAARKAAGAYGQDRGEVSRAVRQSKPGTATPKQGKAEALRRVK